MSNSEAKFAKQRELCKTHVSLCGDITLVHRLYWQILTSQQSRDMKMMRVILIAASLNGKHVQKIFCFVLEEIFYISLFSCLWPVSDLLWSSGEETWRGSHSVLLCVWVLHEQLLQTSPPWPMAPPRCTYRWKAWKLKTATCGHNLESQWHEWPRWCTGRSLSPATRSACIIVNSWVISDDKDIMMKTGWT